LRLQACINKHWSGAFSRSDFSTGGHNKPVTEENAGLLVLIPPKIIQTFIRFTQGRKKWKFTKVHRVQQILAIPYSAL
jgi:hypothetical protein